MIKSLPAHRIAPGMRPRGPMPRIAFEGTSYALRSRKTVVPDLEAMSQIKALLWLCRNTTPTRPCPAKPACRLRRRGQRRDTPLTAAAVRIGQRACPVA